MVDLDALDDDDVAVVRQLVERHHARTPARRGRRRLLDGWTLEPSSFRKVMPSDYQRVLEVIRRRRRGRDVGPGHGDPWLKRDRAVMGADHG